MIKQVCLKIPDSIILDENAGVVAVKNLRDQLAAQIGTPKHLTVKFNDVREGYVDQDFVMGLKTVMARAELHRKPRRRIPASWTKTK